MVTLLVAIAAIFLYERAQVALIIDDEAAWDLRDASPQKKVIVTEGGMVARYLAEDEDNYIGDIQDSVWIPKSRAMVETWYACDGRGVVFLNEEGTEPAYAAPDSLSSVVGELVSEMGCHRYFLICRQRRYRKHSRGWMTTESPMRSTIILPFSR